VGSNSAFWTIIPLIFHAIFLSGSLLLVRLTTVYF
jgi:hypothetical protein